LKNVAIFRRYFSALLGSLLLFTAGCGLFDGDGTEPPSNINALASLTVSEGSLSPAFTITGTQYSVDVANDIDTIQVTATIAEPTATIQINGVNTSSGTASAPINLSVGNNVVQVVATAESGQSKTVSITVIRAQLPSSDASLSSLSVSEGNLSPLFSSQTSQYTVSVANNVGSIIFTPTSTDANASIQVNNVAVASGAASSAINLEVGNTVVNIQVDAENGLVNQTYQITVIRDAPLSSDANLSGLSLSVGSLNPIFSASTTNYITSVDFTTTSITVTATLSNENATGSVNTESVNSGVASNPITLAEGDNTLLVSVLAEDGVTAQSYTVTVSRQAASTFAQLAYIKASNPSVGDFFARSVSVSGNTIAVGSIFEDGDGTGVNGDQSNDNSTDSGAVYVFVRNNDVWSQQAYIKSVSSQQADLFGGSVSLDNDTLVVGASGEDSDATDVNGDPNNNLAINSGAAFVFVRSEGVWSQQALLKASNTGAGDNFGWDVAISGETIIVGANKEDSNATGVNGDQTNESAVDAGSAYIFTRNAGVWSQQAYLKASNTSPDGTQGDVKESFGYSVSIDDDTAIVSAIDENGGSVGVNGDESSGRYHSGAVYVFSRTAGQWSQQAYLKASNADSADRFGFTNAISGDTIAVGTYYESSNATGIDGDQADNSAVQSGAVYIFVRQGGSWSQQAYIKASNTDAGDLFGISVDLDGDDLIVGAQREQSVSTVIDGDQSDNSNGFAGAAYLFKRINGMWTQTYYLKASNAAGGDNFGRVSIDAGLIAVGAYQEDGSVAGINPDQNDNASRAAGALFVFGDSN